MDDSKLYCTEKKQLGSRILFPSRTQFREGLSLPSGMNRCGGPRRITGTRPPGAASPASLRSSRIRMDLPWNAFNATVIPARDDLPVQGQSHILSTGDIRESQRRISYMDPPLRLRMPAAMTDAPRAAGAHFVQGAIPPW